ncbi:MAG: hypothetical protein F6K36_29295 [Symploca sp. SIO3C6]|nr:hypothetical protein [Symploca sp. SIO3C6]
MSTKRRMQPFSICKHTSAQRYKTLILNAVRAFWLPFAYQESPHYTDEQTRRIGWHCVFTLLNQVERICCVLGLDRSELEVWARGAGVAAGVNISNSKPVPVTKPPKTNGVSASNPSQSNAFAGLNMLSYNHPGEDEDD